MKKVLILFITLIGFVMGTSAQSFTQKWNDFKNAKKEYKKAKKKGYAYATSALEACKQHEKEYKRRQKEAKKRGY